MQRVRISGSREAMTVMLDMNMDLFTELIVIVRKVVRLSRAKRFRLNKLIDACDELCRADGFYTKIKIIRNKQLRRARDLWVEQKRALEFKRMDFELNRQE